MRIKRKRVVEKQAAEAEQAQGDNDLAFIADNDTDFISDEQLKINEELQAEFGMAMEHAAIQALAKMSATVRDL